MRTALLIPCYRAIPYLERLKEQVDRLSPTFDEVLLADDASPDKTADHAEALGFRVLRLTENLGPGGARNRLAAAVTSDWIHFHDVDDELAPNYLERVFSMPIDQLDAIYHQVDFIDELTRKFQMRWQTNGKSFRGNPAATLLASPLPSMASFLRRSAFLSLRGFDEKRRCFEDGDFHFRLAASGARIALLPEVLEWSLRHSGGASANTLYCQRCRLEFLESYATSVSNNLLPIVAMAAETCARALVREGDFRSARKAVAIAHRLGHLVPSTHNPLFRMARRFLPATLLLLIQQRIRSSNHS